MRRRYIIPSILTTLVAAFAVYVNVWAVDPVYSSERQQSQPETVVTAAPATPSPTPAAQKTSATVASLSPRPAPSRAVTIKGDSLSIPAIGFLAPVIEVGVTATNNIDVPSDLKVGHWIGSATPGTPGAVFLDGHVDGVFARLPSVKTGAIISINYGGKTFRYRVVHTETVPLESIDMGKALSIYGGGSEGLNLMTCAGTYVAEQGTYDHRFVVYSVRIDT